MRNETHKMRANNSLLFCNSKIFVKYPLHQFWPKKIVLNKLGEKYCERFRCKPCLISLSLSRFFSLFLILNPVNILTFFMPMFPSYRNQSTDLYYKSIDWFLYEMNIGMKKVNLRTGKHCSWLVSFLKL